MSCQKKPLALRGMANRTDTAPVALASAALIVLASVTTPANAADNNKKSATADKPAAKQAEVTQLEGVTAQGKKAEPRSNPYADPEAPYKIDRSGNSKFTEPLVNTSKIITVIGKEQMEDAGISALKDLMRMQPSVTMGTGEGGNAEGDRFMIRGFDVRNDLFVDGMRDPGSTVRDVFATEQIEISKGPSSTFAGRGTTGGAVNSVSKKPQDANFARANLTVGDENRAVLDGNRVVNDKIKVRGNLMVEDSDVPGRNHVYKKGQGAAVSADFQATEKLGMALDLYHLRGEQMPDRGHPWHGTAPAKVNRDNFYGIVGRNFQDTGADIVTGTLQYDLSPNTTITSKTRSGETTNKYIVSNPGSINATTTPVILPTTMVTPSAHTGNYTNTFVGNNTQITHEFHTSSDVEHTIVAGVEASKEEVTNRPFRINTFNATTNPTGVVAPTLNVLEPNNNVAAPGIHPTNPITGESKVEADVESVYLMDTIKLNPKWQVFGGLRHDKFDVTSSSFNYQAGATAGVIGTVSAPVKYKKGFNNWHAGVVYKPKENGSIYISSSTSSNMPGEMYDGVGDVAYGGLNAQVAGYEPERNKVIEVGTKWNLANDNLSVSAVAFKQEKKNKIESNTSNLGAAQIDGVELGIAGNVTDKLSLSGGAVYMDTKVTNSATATNIGRPLANVAEQSATIQAKYQATPKLAVGGAVVHQGKMRNGVFAAATQQVPSSNRLDVMAEYQFSKKLGLQLNVKNATDKTIYEAMYRSASPFTYVAPGRTSSVTLTYDF